jgi:hypothetical protein
MEEKERKKKLLIRKIVQIVIVVILISVTQYYFVKDKSAGKELTALVTKYDTACPIMISNDIRMEGVHSLPNNIVQYDFTLVHIQKENTDVNALKTEVEKEIMASSKTNPSLEAFRDNNSTVIYNYKDRNQQNLFDVRLTPEMY